MSIRYTATRLIGVLIVCTWVVMLGLLVRRAHFPPPRPTVSVQTAHIDAYGAEREWLEIYLKGKKVGYAVNHIKPLGEEGYLVQDEMFMRLTLMEIPSQVHSLILCAVDQHFFLKNFRFTLTSGAVDFHAIGTVEGEWLRIVTGRGKDRRTSRIRLSEPPMITSGLSRFFRGQSLQEGETYRFPLFDPSTFSQTEASVHVRGKGEVEIHGVKYVATRLDAEVLGQRITLWLDEQGAVLKQEGLLGLTLIKSSASKATRAIEGGEGVDLYDLAAVSVAKRIHDPRRVTRLTLKAAGLEDYCKDAGGPDAGRQRCRDGRIEITRETLPRQPGYALSQERVSTDLAPYVQPDTNIESDAGPVMEKATEIADGVRDPVLVARRLTTWVFENVEKRPVLSVPSAREVLKTRVGDCNEHAVLLTAFLRGLGIPARVCVGLVLARDKFYYHAWVEAYFGEWVSMDPTLNQMPADATHIKLAQGGLDRQVEIIRLLGKIKIEVLEYGYD